MIDAARRYAELELRRPLRWGGGAVQLHRPETGRRSLLAIAHPEGREPVVIRLFRNLEQRRRLASALALGDRHDLPIPRLLRQGWGAAQRRRHGFAFLVESCEPGQPLPKGAPGSAVSRSLAEALARLHRVRSSRWGRPDKLHRRSLKENWRRSVRRKLAILAEAQPPIPEAPLRQAEEWFALALARMDEPRFFHLCHHHLAPDDILYDPASGKVTLVDCFSLQFSRAARDLARLWRFVYQCDDAAWNAFRPEYARRIPEAEDPATRGEETFFRAFNELASLARAVQSGADPAPALERLARRVAIPFGA